MPAHVHWNLWHGCHKCSAGCQNCYMYFLDNYRGLPEETSSVVKRTGRFDYPLKKDRHKNYKVQPGERIMVNMTSDTFIEEADPWRDEMWDIIKTRSDVIFWLLTKRPERIKDHLPKDWGNGYENVSLNATCENQEMFDKRVPIMIDLPAKHKGLCLAPLLGPIDLTLALQSGEFDEIEVGGENYDNPRPCYYNWIQSMSKQCEIARVNFCFYETGTKFVVNDKMYFMPRKADQSAAAYFSGLSHKFYDIQYKLVDQNGVILQSEQLYQKVYNLNHCTFCANRMVCNGCSNCGDCQGPVELGTLDDLWKKEDEMLREMTSISGAK